MRLRILFLFLSISLVSKGQTISGLVTDAGEKPLANVTVSLLKAKDSLLLKTAITNAEGRFSIGHNYTAELLVQVSAVGFDPVLKLVEPGKMIRIVMEKSTKQLKEVVVTARKPLVEVRPDKLVFNVEGSINAAGSNALELLQKSPGVIVDKDDNIILSGKNGVRVYVDGKPSPLGPADLAAYLRSMNSNDIEAIEIITNPSAKYDAEGNAGIINIRLKRNKNFGWNGSVSGGYGIGIYSKYNGGLSLNYRNKRINFYSNYSAYNSKNESQLNLYRIQNDTTYDQRSTSIYYSKGHNLKTGLDIFLNKKNVLGIMFNANFSDNDWSGNSRTPIAAEGARDMERVLTALGKSTSNRNNITGNINYKFADTSGRELNIDADYGMYRLRNNGVTPNVYTKANTSQVESIYTFSTNTPTNIDLISLKADYEQNFAKGKLSTGFKSSQVRTDNDFSFFNHDINDNPVFDNQRSNRFLYTEWINAVYGQYKRQIKKINYQVGIRFEQTNSKGDLRSEQAIDNKIVKRSYLDFFPSAGISYQLNQTSSIGFSYSRRIDRPRYQDLNPFENKIDELSYQKGNPFLRPQYTHSVELRHTYKYTLTTTLSYSDVRDYFAQISDTIEGKRNFLMQRNLANQKIISLNISYPFSITKWWSVYANLNVYHTRYNASFEQGKTIRLNATVASIYQQQTFQLGKKWTAELSGFFNSPSIWGGTYQTRSIWSLDAGLQKRFWKDNASIKLSVSDLFFKMPWRGTSEFGGLYIIASGRWESRQLKMNFTYRFGNKQVKSARNRNTGLDDLKGRVD